MRNVMDIAKQLASRDRTSGEPEHSTYVSYVIWTDENHYNAAACGKWECDFIPRQGEIISVVMDNPVRTDVVGLVTPPDKVQVFGKVNMVRYEVVKDATFITITAVQF